MALLTAFEPGEDANYGDSRKRCALRLRPHAPGDGSVGVMGWRYCIGVGLPSAVQATSREGGNAVCHWAHGARPSVDPPVGLLMGRPDVHPRVA